MYDFEDFSGFLKSFFFQKQNKSPRKESFLFKAASFSVYLRRPKFEFSHSFLSKYAFIFCIISCILSNIANIRCSLPEVFLGKGVLKYSRTPIPKCALRHGGSSIDLLYIFRMFFPKNTSGRLL